MKFIILFQSKSKKNRLKRECDNFTLLSKITKTSIKIFKNIQFAKKKSTSGKHDKKHNDT